MASEREAKMEAAAGALQRNFAKEWTPYREGLGESLGRERAIQRARLDRDFEPGDNVHLYARLNDLYVHVEKRDQKAEKRESHMLKLVLLTLVVSLATLGVSLVALFQ